MGGAPHEGRKEARLLGEELRCLRVLVCGRGDKRRLSVLAAQPPQWIAYLLNELIGIGHEVVIIVKVFVWL